MAAYVMLVIFFAVCVVAPLHVEAGHTLMCPSCELAKHREDCYRTLEKCRHDEVCHAAAGRVHDSDGTATIRYRFGCADPSECNSLMGKRDSHHVSAHTLCTECCDTQGCYQSLCDLSHAAYTQQHMHWPTTTPPPIHSATPAIHRHCMSCSMVRDPADCHTSVTCADDQVCYTNVLVNLYGEHFFNMHCGRQSVCFNINRLNIFGKRSGNALSRIENTVSRSDNTEARGHDTGTRGHDADARSVDSVSRRAEIMFKVCADCCYDHRSCNKFLCGNFAPTKPISVSIPTTMLTPTPLPTTTTTATTSTSTRPTTTTTTTARPTTTTVASPTTPARENGRNSLEAVDPRCHDKEEDGITCLTLDLFGVCSDPAPFAYFMAHEKCPKHCGFCTSTTQTNTVHVTPPPSGVCENFEQDGYNCASLDGLFSMCTGSSTIEYVIAHKKCPKYCGFCHAPRGTQPPTTQPTTTQVTATKPTSTQPTSTRPTTTAQTTTQPTTMQPTTTPTATTSHASAGGTCIDIEGAGFTCSAWAAQGFCAPTPGSGYETAKLRCRKYCGFC